MAAGIAGNGVCMDAAELVPLNRNPADQAVEGSLRDPGTVRERPGMRVILESSGAGTVAPEEFMAGSKRRG